MNLEEEAVDSLTQSPLDEIVEVFRTLMHELSQPLTSLRGSLELALLSDVKESECRKVLQQSLAEAQRLVAGLATLREVLEAEDPGKDFQRVNWKQMVTKVVRDVAPAARGQRLRLILEPLADVYVKVNPPRVEASLRELLRRLIGSGPGRRTFRIGLSAQARTASLLVCDEGPASEAAVSAATTPPASNSTGDLQRTELAWWILRRSIAGQGGRLEIEKTPPRGVRCRVTFPLASSDVTGTAST